MFNKAILATAFTLFAFVCHPAQAKRLNERQGQGDGDRQLWYFHRPRQYEATLRNIAYDQPMSPFFVAVHNSETTPLFELGKPASSALATLAEEGSPADLVELYNGGEANGVMSVQVAGDGLLRLGEETSFVVDMDRDHRFISIASMAVNTNDCFVALSAVSPYAGGDKTILVPGYDSGTEENNELCTSVPGPACSDTENGPRSENGEGYVHVHRGIHGVGDLSRPSYDWRNPMLSVTFEKMETI